MICLVSGFIPNNWMDLQTKMHNDHKDYWNVILLELPTTAHMNLNVSDSYVPKAKTT